MIEVDVYIHGTRENLLEIGKKLNLTGKALEQFSFACTEVRLTLAVIKDTGIASIVAIEGQRLKLPVNS